MFKPYFLRVFVTFLYVYFKQYAGNKISFKEIFKPFQVQGQANHFFSTGLSEDNGVVPTPLSQGHQRKESPWGMWEPKDLNLPQTRITSLPD